MLAMTQFAVRNRVVSIADIGPRARRLAPFELVCNTNCLWWAVPPTIVQSGIGFDMFALRPDVCEFVKSIRVVRLIARSIHPFIPLFDKRSSPNLRSLFLDSASVADLTDISKLRQLTELSIRTFPTEGDFPDGHPLKELLIRHLHLHLDNYHTLRPGGYWLRSSQSLLPVFAATLETITINIDQSGSDQNQIAAFRNHAPLNQMANLTTIRLRFFIPVLPPSRPQANQNVAHLSSALQHINQSPVTRVEIVIHNGTRYPLIGPIHQLMTFLDGCISAFSGNKQVVVVFEYWSKHNDEYGSYSDSSARTPPTDLYGDIRAAHPRVKVIGRELTHFVENINNENINDNDDDDDEDNQHNQLALRQGGRQGGRLTCRRGRASGLAIQRGRHERGGRLRGARQLFSF